MGIISVNLSSQKKFRLPVFVIAGAWFLFMVLYTLFGRLTTEVDGTIISRQIISEPRRGTIYSLRDSKGNLETYVAGATDASLSRDIPIGTHVTKKRWHLGYNLNDNYIDDFSITFYSIVASVGVCCLWFAIIIGRSNKSAS
jgi:hypothetical protein